MSGTLRNVPLVSSAAKLDGEAPHHIVDRTLPGHDVGARRLALKVTKEAHYPFALELLDALLSQLRVISDRFRSTLLEWDPQADSCRPYALSTGTGYCARLVGTA